MKTLSLPALARHKRALLLAGAAAVLLAAALFLLLRPGGVLKVVDFLGSVLVERSERDPFQVFNGFRVEAGDMMRTGKASNVTVDLDEKKLIRLKEESAATFEELRRARSSESIAIYLENGTLINDLREKLTDGDSYTVSTPNTTVSVRGTYFVVQVGERADYTGVVTTVNVYHGSVSVRGANGQEIILRAGEGGASQLVVERDGEGGVTIPQGNRAVIGEKTLEVFRGVDFSGLDAGDLERLKEYAAEPGTGYTPAELDAAKALQPPAATPAPTGTPEETPAPSAREEGPSGESEVDDASGAAGSDGRAGGEGAFIGPPAPQPEVTAVPLPAAPSPEAPAGTPGQTGKPSAGADAADGGGEGGGAAVLPPSPSSTPTSTPSAPVAPGASPAPSPSLDDKFELQVADRAAVETALGEIGDRLTALEGIEASLTQGQRDALASARESVDAASQKLGDMDAANAALGKINALAPLASVSSADTAAVQEARDAYEALTPAQRALLPQTSVQKLEKCKEKLGIS